MYEQTERIAQCLQEAAWLELMIQTSEGDENGVAEEQAARRVQRVVQAAV
jgi:hypothetical protein